MVKMAKQLLKKESTLNVIIYSGITMCLLIIIFMGLLFMKFNNKEIKKEPTYETIVIAFPSYAEIPEDIKEIEEEISKITIEKFGVKVQLKIVNISSYKQEMQFLMAGQSNLDIMLACEGLLAYGISEKKLYPLEQELSNYGKGIIEALSDEVIQASYISGSIFGLPNNRSYATKKKSFAMRNDILKKYGIDYKTIDTIEEVESIFEMIKQNESEMVILASEGLTPMENLLEIDPIGDNLFGIYKDNDDNGIPKFENLFESEEYKEYLYLIRKWHTLGYTNTESATQKDYLQNLIRTGKIFSYTIDANILSQMLESKRAGKDMVIVSLGEEYIYSNELFKYTWTIPTNAKNYILSLAILNLMYSDENIMNLLCYGIEGKHYTTNEDGRIKENELNLNKYQMANNIIMPNLFITKVWETQDKDLWEQCRISNKEQLNKVGVGYFHEISPVKTEYGYIEKLYTSYRLSLENGLVDPGDVVYEMNKYLVDAGLKSIISAKRNQFIYWKDRVS